MKTNRSIVKRMGALALASLFALSLAACGPQGDSGATATPTVQPQVPITGQDGSKTTMPPAFTPPPIHKLDDFSYQFIRIPHSSTANTAAPRVIKSLEELREAVSAALANTVRTTVTAADYLQDYNDDFFKSNYVLVFNLTFSSGSVIPKVESVKLENGEVSVVTAGEMHGDVGTADMASYMCLLSLDAAKFPENSTFKVSGAGTAQASDARVNKN